MSQTAADLMVGALEQWGVELVFGMPGDGNNGLMEAFRKRQEAIRFIQVRHEEAAALMATGYAKSTGKLGVCVATSGPGGLHLINGLYDAKCDGQPVLAITGNQFHDLMRTFGQQDVDLDKVFADVAVYNARIMGPAHVENVTHLACRTASAYHGVAHITFPVDIQSASANDSGSFRNVPNHMSDVEPRSARVPPESSLQAAAKVINSGSRVVILAGRGALGATDELVELARKCQAPIVKALLGKAAVPDDSPYTTGCLGLLGTRPSQEAIEQCDTLLMVGTSFPYIEFLPKPDQARAVQIDIDPQRIGLRYPVEVGLVGDSRATLRGLLPHIHGDRTPGFYQQIREGVRQWWELMEERGTRKDQPMKPQVVAWELGKRLPDDAVVACDSGTITTWWARQIPTKRGQIHLVSGSLATMGCALPYAIAGQLAFPRRPCIAFVGDGGFAMLMSELATCVKYKLPVKIIVFKNNTLGQIKWEQMVFLGNPEYQCELQPIDFAAVAKAFGATGLKVEDPADCGRVLDEALATVGPVVVEAVVDPFEPPMPPKVSISQAANFGKSLLRGEPNRTEIALTAVSNVVRELV
jgi:pyruvate dehydrogenase (quinone)/pyruvate oxidase